MLENRIEARDREKKRFSSTWFNIECTVRLCVTVFEAIALCVCSDSFRIFHFGGKTWSQYDVCWISYSFVRLVVSHVLRVPKWKQYGVHQCIFTASEPLIQSSDLSLLLLTLLHTIEPNELHPAKCACVRLYLLGISAILFNGLFHQQ